MCGLESEIVIAENNKNSNYVITQVDVYDLFIGLELALIKRKAIFYNAT